MLEWRWPRRPNRAHRSRNNVPFQSCCCDFTTTHSDKQVATDFLELQFKLIITPCCGQIAQPYLSPTRSAAVCEVWTAGVRREGFPCLPTTPSATRLPSQMIIIARAIDWARVLLAGGGGEAGFIMQLLLPSRWISQFYRNIYSLLSGCGYVLGI